MVVLHIAKIKNVHYSGVCVVVPQHVKYQSEYASVGFINVNNIKIEGVGNQFEYCNSFSLEDLPYPFSKPDLLVFHEVYKKCYLKICKTLDCNNVPYVIIPHGELTQGAQKKKWLKKKVANFLLFNRFINGAAAIQCLSERELEATLFGKNKFIGTNGVDLPKIKKQSFSENVVRFTYVGRLEVKIKGIDLLIKAIAEEKKNLSAKDYEFKIYGPDLYGQGDEIRKLIVNNDVGSVLSLNSEIFGSEKEKILLDSDIFIQTSRSEGMPLGMLEALSYGIPCFVTKGTGLGDLIQKYDAGWVAETNAEDIARVLTVAIQEKALYPQKGANARRLVEENFSWSNVAKSTIAKYSAIVGVE